MSKLPPFKSQITFLYYDDLEAAADFYEEIIGLELVMVQEMARIYRTAGDAYLGIVDGSQGYHQPQEKNAVVVSLTVDDVVAWYESLRAQGVTLLSAPQLHTKVPVFSFFFQDPGGYTLEIQRFEKEWGPGIEGKDD
jgi:predicted enzyme related to lactoylglutathione lyase